VLCFLTVIALAGCAGTLSTENQLLSESDLKLEDPAYFASDENLRRGKLHFRNGDYGIAEKYFRKSVEVTPNDTEAWLGLAASYDRLRRFNLADKAYKKVIRLDGKHPAVLNNIAYSYLLRGDMIKARRYFLRAYERDPENPYIVNNLAQLGVSEKAVKRSIN